MVLPNCYLASLRPVGRPALPRGGFFCGSTLWQSGRNHAIATARLPSVQQCIHKPAKRGPDVLKAQSSVSEGEKSTEEDLAAVANLRAIFEEADSDGNGLIDRQELKRLLKEGSNKLDPLTLSWLSEASSSDIMDSFDPDEEGGLTFEEFASLARAGALLKGKFSEYRQAFERVDMTGNGKLNAVEIQRVFEELGQPINETKLWKIFDKYDSNRNGQIDFAEFLQMFRDELLDLREILQYLTMHPRKASSGSKNLIEAQLGTVTLIFSEAELDSLLQQHESRLVVLEASMTWCRPCKGFERSYQKFAESFSHTLFLKFYGNSNEDCKHLLEERLEVPSTPTFTFFRRGTALSHVSGTSRQRLYDALLGLLEPEENPVAQLNPFQQQVWRTKLGLG